MPHADAAQVPENILDKREFWDHVHSQLEALLAGERNWISNLANASSLLFNSLLAFPAHFGSGEKAVNWCGFYLVTSLFPSRIKVNPVANRLLLGPFCGKPACQFIDTSHNVQHGVCAEAFLKGETILVPNVHEHAGHIACDADTKSEIVCPLFLRTDSGVPTIIGVLDLDCLATDGFDEVDKEGLESIVKLIVESCDW